MSIYGTICQIRKALIPSNLERTLKFTTIRRMFHTPKIDTIVLCDATSADNFAMVSAATRPGSPLNVIAVVITGRAAHSDKEAPTEERQDQRSEWVRCGNARRMAGFLKRAGRDVPVFFGMPMRFTRIRTVIPHRVHVDEMEVYDLHDDRHNADVAGNFKDFLRLLRAYGGKNILVLAGGPLTELAYIQMMCEEDIMPKLGTLLVQAGDFGEGNASNLIGGAGNSFNGACDSTALDAVLTAWPGDVVLLPSNITKAPEIGFSSPSEMEALGMRPGLLELYQVHYEHTAKRRGAKLFVHDLGLVILAEQLLEGAGPYHIEPIQLVGMPYEPPKPGEQDRRGTIFLEVPAKRQTALGRRFRVVAQSAEEYMERAEELLKI